MFKTYTEATRWIETKAVEYGGKQKFYSSDEYRNAYPEITRLYKEHKSARNARDHAAADSAGFKDGERVYVVVGHTIWGPIKRPGTLDRSGDQMVVRLDEPYVKPGNVRGRRVYKSCKIMKMED